MRSAGKVTSNGFICKEVNSFSVRLKGSDFRLLSTSIMSSPGGLGHTSLRLSSPGHSCKDTAAALSFSTSDGRLQQSEERDRGEIKDTNKFQRAFPCLLGLCYLSRENIFPREPQQFSRYILLTRSRSHAHLKPTTGQRTRIPRVGRRLPTQEERGGF